jgi:chromosome segregation ATPase
VSQTIGKYLIKKEIESIKESMKTDSVKLTQLRTNISFLENELMRIRLEIELKQDAENLIGEKLNHLKEKQEYINNNYSAKNGRLYELDRDFHNPNRDRRGE